MVKPRPITRIFFCPCSSAWCAQVTAVPDSSRISVFISGSWNGLNVWTPSGGQDGLAAPETWTGYSAKWKLAQKKPTKNITSEAMNSIMP